MSNYKIIFFGTSDFAREILRGLLGSDYKVAAVVTQPDKPTGRSQVLTASPVKELSLKKKISILQPEKLKGNREIVNQLQELSPDLFIVAAYGQIIPKEILAIPKSGSLNVHPSLLPKYRGSSPIQAAILNGDAETGTTIMLVDEEMDHGPIIADLRYRIQDSKPTAEELKKILAEQGVKLLVKTIPKWLAGEIKPREQDHAKATFTKILTREDGKIDWQKSAEEIERQIRAYTSWPESFTELEGKRLKITRTKVVKAEKAGKTGEVYKTLDGELAVFCGQDSLILETVQLEGKKETTGRQFLNGHPGIIGKNLE